MASVRANQVAKQISVRRELKRIAPLGRSATDVTAKLHKLVPLSKFG